MEKPSPSRFAPALAFGLAVAFGPAQAEGASPQMVRNPKLEAQVSSLKSQVAELIETNKALMTAVQRLLAQHHQAHQGQGGQAKGKDWRNEVLSNTAGSPPVPQGTAVFDKAND